MKDSLYAALAHDGPLVVGKTVALGARATGGLRFRGVNPKEAFTIGDSEGRYFRASLVTLAETSATALVYETMHVTPESPVRITLVCAVLQRQRMLWVCQKASELGVMHIQPVITMKSVQPEGLEHEKFRAWPSQALKGARQCRRASVPDVLPAIALEHYVTGAAWASADARTFLDDRAGVEALPRGSGSLMLVVGPEGGFDLTEQQLLIRANAVPLRLGGRVLRAETAMLAAVAVAQHCLGDMGVSQA